MTKKNTTPTQDTPAAQEPSDDDLQTAFPVDDLEKGLAALEAAAIRPPSRKEELLEKAKTERLDRNERRELDSLMGGSDLSSQIASDDDLIKAMDVSPALDSLATVIADHVDRMTDTLEKSLHSQDKRFGALSQTLLAMGQGLKALAAENADLRKSFDAFMDGPARDPRAEARPADGTISKALDKPFRGETPPEKPAEPQLDRRQLTRVLEAMHSDSISKSLGGKSRTGLNIRSEMAAVVSGRSPSPEMLREIDAYIKEMGAGAAA